MGETKDHLDPQNSEQVLSSFHEWMVQHAEAAKSATGAVRSSDPDNCASVKSASIAPELSIKSSSGASQERPGDPSEQANVPPGGSNRSSFETLVVRAICGLLVVVAVAAAWQAYRDDQTMKLVQAWKHSSVIWLSDALDAALGADRRQSESATEPAAEPSNTLSDQAKSMPATTSTPTKEFAELNEQLQTVANDLVVLRRSVEQLTAKQEQISRDILTVQATEQNVSEKISSLTQAAPVHAPPRRNVARFVRSETPRQPTTASVSSQPPPAATATPVDQPPRPPLPLPAAAETPAPLH
jgi:uncharacterized protein YoxC